MKSTLEIQRKKKQSNKRRKTRIITLRTSGAKTELLLWIGNITKTRYYLVVVVAYYIFSLVITLYYFLSCDTCFVYTLELAAMKSDSFA